MVRQKTFLDYQLSNDVVLGKTQCKAMSKNPCLCQLGINFRKSYIKGGGGRKNPWIIIRGMSPLAPCLLYLKS